MALDLVVSGEPEDPSGGPPSGGPSDETARRETKRRRGLFVVVLGAVAAVSLLGRTLPREQHVRVVLGASAPTVREVRLRYSEGGQGHELLREATFRYAQGTAPRIVVHTPSLPDGEYDIEIDVLGPAIPATIERHATLHGDTLTLDVAEALRR